VQTANGSAPAPTNNDSARSVAFAAQVPIEKAVEVAPPPAPLPPDTTFSGMVDRQDPAASRNAAVQAILKVWNIQLLSNLPANDTVSALTAFANDNKLSAENMTLRLEQIEAINLPALIKLHGRTRSIWAAIVGAEGDDLKITTASNDVKLVPRDKVNDCYLNEAIVLWRDAYPEITTLKTGMSGEDVRVLQVQLRTLGRLEQAPTGTFDQATADAIRTVQRDVGLKVDGAYGKHTRMVLSSWMPGFTMPGLRAMPPLLMHDAETQGSAAPADTTTEANATKKVATPAKSETKQPAKKKMEAQVAKVPGTSGPLDSAPKPAASETPPVKTEELPKPGEAPAAPPVVAPAAAPPAETAPQTQGSETAQTWPGGLPLVPAEPDATSP
jgi:peptidoglycan hydrolase-like protein with peptidoglycan-binding domain